MPKPVRPRIPSEHREIIRLVTRFDMRDPNETRLFRYLRREASRAARLKDLLLLGFEAHERAVQIAAQNKKPAPTHHQSET